MMKAERFFSDDEKRRIAETVRQAERGTDGEIAVMVVDRSDPYREAEVLGGAIFGSMLAFVLTHFFFEASLYIYVPLSFLFFFPFRYLGRKYPYLKPIFIGPGRVEEAVQRRAFTAFYEKGLHRTRFQTGVLIFISLFEHKVWILADKGIHEKIKQETLDRFAGEISRGIREGRAAAALSQAIEELGKVLAAHFPLSPGDVNELPDEILTGK
jgi:putative membrane protein